MAGNEESKKKLVEKIHQFFSNEIETNNDLSEAAKESLVVAVECIEQAYNVSKKPASSDLLDIFKKATQDNQQSNLFGSDSSGSNPAQFISNLANSFLNQASGSQTTTTASSAPNPTSNAPSTTKKQRKIATDAEKLSAESFKNQGNDFMKQNKYQEAYDSYSRAIEIDDNNAIYYSNRAAASSRLCNHQDALNDCQEAIDIDPTYSKAYGRLGLSYASLERHQEAKEAYTKAVEFDPTNESYRNNLKIAEEKLNEARGSAGGGQNNVVNMLRSMMTNPDMMQIAMRTLSDPRVQGVFTGIAGQMAQGAMSQVGLGQQAQTENVEHRSSPTPTQGSQPSSDATQPDQNQQHQEQQEGQEEQQQQQAGTEQQNQARQNFNPADLLNFSSRISNGGNIDLFSAGQQLLANMEQSNPDLLNNMRRMMSQAFMPPNQNDPNNRQNPPPGYT